MANYFFLKLDTDPPNAKIKVQSVPSNTPSKVEINANEALSKIQDIYYLDETGARTDLKLTTVGRRIVGSVVFPREGTYTIHANVRDVVLNETPIQETIFIKERKIDKDKITIELSDSSYASITLEDEG